MNRSTLLNQAQAFFCRGMTTDSYASGAPPIGTAGLPKWKGYLYREGDFRLEDTYYVHPSSSKSVGMTRIWCRGEMVWHMSYGGYYAKEATPCLKAALMENYRRGIFLAGRGRDLYQLGNCRYIIRPGAHRSFERFSAQESVVRINAEARDPREPSDTTALGGHEVWGMALV